MLWTSIYQPTGSRSCRPASQLAAVRRSAPNSHGSDAQISCRVNRAPIHASLSVTASSNRRGSINPREGAVFTELRRLWAPYFGGLFHSPDRNETGCDHPPDVSVLARSRSEERRVGKECRCGWGQEH